MLRGLVLAAVFSLAFAAVFVVGAMLTGLGTVPFQALWALPVVALPFAAIGALYGTIFALDGPVQRAPAKYQLLRVVITSLLGALAVYTWQTPSHPATPRWLLLGAVVGCILGLIGWRGAKYVDF